MKNKLLEILHKHDADFLILENCDSHAFLHHKDTQVSNLTNFSGSAGEGVLHKSGKIFLFVDPRYHIQAELQIKKTSNKVELSKVLMGETFLDSIKKIVPKDAKILMDCDISLNKFKKFSLNFPNITTVELPKNIHPHSNKIPLYIVPFEIAGESAQKKIQKIQKFLVKKNAQSFFVSGLEDIAWLTNLRGSDFKFSSQFISKTIIEKNGTILYSDHIIDAPKAEIASFPFKIRPLNDYKKVLEKESGVILYCSNSITKCNFERIKNGVELKKNPIQDFMSVKNKYELKHLQSCFSRLDTALSNFKTKIREGLSELELKEFLEKEIFNTGAKFLSFKTILAIGENSASIHYSHYDEEKYLKNGDLILVDCGAYYEGGYATDITRTFVCGEPNDEQKKVYTLVLKAFLKAYHSNSTSSVEVDSIARKFLKRHAPKRFEFSHSLGHGIGINVHQAPPSLSPLTNSNQKLKSGMVFSIEPGLYCWNKFGVRLENCVYIDTKGQKVSLSHYEFEEKLIDKKMLNNIEKKWLKEWQNGRKDENN